ncbi:hypothetical protein H4Q26_000799 [Puccinia striiformis f. sp. tritici PST-130]|nr:hypothetical protein H4Q26_000799 [Puccinia striiformis f. sp. tritici PST-130]
MFTLTILSFPQLVHDITRDFKTDPCFQSSGVMALQESAGAYLSAPCRALVPASPAPTTSQSRPLQSNNRISVINSADEDDKPKDSQSSNMDCARAPFTVKQVASRTGREVIIDIAQDSDAETDKRQNTGRKKKDPTKDKDGFDHSRLYFYPPGEGPKQDPRTMPGHADGARTNSKRWQSYQAGAHLPPTAVELKTRESKDKANGPGTLTAYATKPQYDNQTLNKLLVIWVIRESLPWLRVEDFHLRVLFNYVLCNTQLNSRVWAASHAHLLYLKQHGQVLKAIKLEELVKEDIVVVNDEMNDIKPEVDANNAEPATPEPGWECNLKNDGDGEEGEVTGIAFTLKKINYICRRIASLPQKQAEWKLWPAQQKQSSEGHHFKGYELSSREWEDVNDLNQVLKEFLEMTKRMEGDGPKLAMVLYKYVRTRDFLGRKREAAAETVLEPMLNSMIRVTQSTSLHMPRHTERGSTIARMTGLIRQHVHGAMIGSAMNDESGDSSEDSDLEDLIVALIILKKNRYLAPRVRLGRAPDITEYLFSLDDVRFKQEFWMSQGSFHQLVSEIQAHPVFQNQSNIPQRPVQDQLMVTLKRMGTYGNGASVGMLARFPDIGGNSYLILFEDHRSHFIVRAQYTSWPDADGRRQIALRVDEFTGFRNCVGFIDGTLFPLYDKPQSILKTTTS